VGRYGKEFLNQVRELRILEDKSKALVSEAGGDNLILEEAASKLFSKKIVELLLNEGVNVTAVPRILSDFAKLQSSSIMREKMKAEYKSRADKTVEKIEQKVKKQVTPETLKYIKEAIYGLAS
jgi:hypothetical protein